MHETNESLSNSLILFLSSRGIDKSIYTYLDYDNHSLGICDLLDFLRPMLQIPSIPNAGRNLRISIIRVFN